MPENEWQCRYSKTLGSLEATHQDIWGTKEYKDEYAPTVFMGVYSFKDYLDIWNHKGRKAILWCGSDIQRFLKGFWLDDEGKMTIRAFDLASWLDTYCESYVENEVEQTALASVGIRSKVVPSFLGDVNNFEVSFKPGNKVYTSVSGNDFKLYGWDKLEELASKNPEIEFYTYGASLPVKWQQKNLIDHGRISKEQMNEEIKEMQGCLRLTEFDGFSEIVAKALLMGQYPVSIIDYPHTLKPDEIQKIKYLFESNIKGREWLLKNVNQYPWNKNVQV